jgi:glutamine amidotransferase
MKSIAVIDYGMGNLRSVSQALEHVAPAGTRIIVTSSAQDIYEADRIVFPGQGAARDCMRELRDHDLVDVISKVSRQQPFLGICMGLQVLMDASKENGGTDCLGIYPGRVLAFDKGMVDEQNGQVLKIPHMGWNQIQQKQRHPLWESIPQNSRFYFVHSFYVYPKDETMVAGETVYGHPFTSVIARDNVFAIQAHPEKSATAGLQLLRNFTRWNGEPH